MERIVVVIDVDKFDGEDVEGCYSVQTPLVAEELDQVVFEAGFVGFNELMFEIKTNVTKVLLAR